MADIRIKDLAVTASASSSDDYLAIDGSTNGTRKLSAYNPTFGGNLTVSGTGTIGSNLTVNGSTISLPSTSGNVDLFGRLFALNVSNETRLYAGSSGISLYDHIGTGRLAQFTQSLLTFDKDTTFAGQVNILNSNSYIKADSSNLVYETYAGKAHQFKTGGTTALTLDSSQNAVFAGGAYFSTLKGPVFDTGGGGSSTIYGNNSNGILYFKNGNQYVAGAMTFLDYNDTVMLTLTNASIFVANTAAAPSSNPTGGGYLYVDGGALKYRGSSGTVTTIANA